MVFIMYISLDIMCVWKYSRNNYGMNKIYINIDNCGVSAAMELTNIPAIFGVLAAAIEFAT